MCELARPTALYIEMLALHSDIWGLKPRDRSYDTGHHTKTRPPPNQRH